MKKIYLACVERRPYGLESGGVSFFSGLSQITLSDDNIKLFFKHVFETEETPSQVLEKLEIIVFEQLQEEPSALDPFRGFPEDEAPEYSDYPRKSSYLAEAGWPKRGETQYDANKRIRGNTAVRNRKLLAIYNSFIKSVSAKEVN